MSENQVSNNLELHPPTLRENYKISNLKWKESFFFFFFLLAWTENRNRSSLYGNASEDAWQPGTIMKNTAEVTLPVRKRTEREGQRTCPSPVSSVECQGPASYCSISEIPRRNMSPSSALSKGEELYYRGPKITQVSDFSSTVRNARQCQSQVRSYPRDVQLVLPERSPRENE